MGMKDLFDYSLSLLHDPIQEGLKVYFIALAYSLVNKTNKRTVQNACQPTDDSKQK
ncbi:hypothetical protein [Bacillus cereus]|uniref:hypothetical protein n=1 Tax=Bacillus cereus TaxID=1396 RepID=UPI0015CF714E|nr:hypothetical protein [Bacillus cereus]